MKYIKEMKEGDRIQDVYLCKTRQDCVSKAGKPYISLTLQDRTGTASAKVWEPSSMGIGSFEESDFIEISADVTTYNGTLQVNIRRLAACTDASRYNVSDYMPTSERDNEIMYRELLELVGSVKDSHLRKVLDALFVNDVSFIEAFRKSSAAKKLHHAVVGGLLEHTLSVTKLCVSLAQNYPLLKRDLLVTAALCHDIGKTRELSPYPKNAYTDEGQLLGHIVIGTQMLDGIIRRIDDFPEVLRIELLHCIEAHHGELEFGSPVRPAIPEALALSFADNLDAKMQMLKEMQGTADSDGWIPYSKDFESRIMVTRME